MVLWSSGFTKSQGHYRYKNQALLKRNYIPNMLGWFLLNESTTLQEFELLNHPVQPGQPNDVSVDFDVKEDQAFYIVIGAVGESGSINKVVIDFNGYQAYKFDVKLKPNWSLTYRGDNYLLVYDEVGRLNKKISFEQEKLRLKTCKGNIRVSAEFSPGSDIKLQGYVRLKGDFVQLLPM